MPARYDALMILDDTIKTLVSDAITITDMYHAVAAESGTTDNLATITIDTTALPTTDGANTFRPFVVIWADTGDTITVKHGTGNIYLNSAVDYALSGNKQLLLFYNGTNWTDLAASASGGGTMSSFTVAGDSGTPQTISDSNTLTIAGGTGLDSVASATDTITLNIDSTVATLTGSQNLTNKTLTTPTIADFTNAGHNHTNAAGGGQLTDAALSAPVGIAKGGTGQATATAGFDALAPTTTKGDIIVSNGSDNIRLAVGTDGQHLEADSTQASGLKWADESGGTSPQTILQGLRLRWLANDKIMVSGGTVSHGTTLINKTSGTVLTMGTAGDWIDGASGEAASSFAHVYINSSGTLKLHDTMPNNSSSTAATYIADARINQAGWNGTAGNGLNATSVVYDTDTGEGNIAAGMLLGVYSDSIFTLGRGKGSAATATLQHMSFALITAVNTGTNTLTLEAGHQIAMNDNDYLIVIENAPVVYRDESGTVWRWIGAIFNDGSSNLDTNRQDFRATHALNEGADPSTSSTSFVDVSSNFDHTTICPVIHDLYVGLAAMVALTTADNGLFDVMLDGTNYFGDDGLLGIGNSDSATMSFPTSFFEPLLSLLPGTHAVKLRWRTAGTSPTIFIRGGAGSANADVHSRFTTQVGR